MKDTRKGPAGLLLRMLMCSEAMLDSMSESLQGFVEALASNPSLGPVILSLMESDCDTLVRAALITVCTIARVLGEICFSLKLAVPIAAATVPYIEAGDPVDVGAARALAMLTQSCGKAPAGFALSRAVEVTPKFVENLTRIIKSQGKETFLLYMLVADHLEHSEGRGKEEFLIAAQEGSCRSHWIC